MYGAARQPAALCSVPSSLRAKCPAKAERAVSSHCSGFLVGRAQFERTTLRSLRLHTEAHVSKEPMPASSNDMVAPSVLPRLRVALCSNLPVERTF